MLDDREVGVRFPVGARDFLKTLKPALGPTQPPIRLIPEAVSPGGKPAGRDAEYSSPSSAEVKNYGALSALPHASSRRDA
jgi:hypothetical protein